MVLIQNYETNVKLAAIILDLMYDTGQHSYAWHQGVLRLMQKATIQGEQKDITHMN